MDTPLYSLKDLSQRFGKRTVLHIPSLRLEPGLIYGLMGPNGAGKTTLMRILAFMDNPYSGEIVFQGQSVRPEQAARHRARVVWVPQSPVLFSGTLLYNIEYPMRLKGVPRRERRQKAAELLNKVQLSHLAQAPARKLSGGEAQRASIARALAAGAEVLLFDEPSANVDFRSRGELIALIRNVWKERALSVVVTTHDNALADELCQERITLFEGGIASRIDTREGRDPMPHNMHALPARMELQEGAWRLHVPSAAFPSASCHDVAATLTGLAACDDGTVLRLHLSSGHTMDVLLSGQADVAGQLALRKKIVLSIGR